MGFQFSLDSSNPKESVCRSIFIFDIAVVAIVVIIVACTPGSMGR